MHESFFMALRAFFRAKSSLLIFLRKQDEWRVLVIYKRCHLMTLTTADGGASEECQDAQNPLWMAMQAPSFNSCRMLVSVCKIYVRSPRFGHPWHAIKAMTGWRIPDPRDIRIALDDNHLTSDQVNVIYSRMAGRYIRQPFAQTPVNERKNIGRSC